MYACLAGGDLANLLVDSAEPRAASWRRWRQLEDGLGEAGLREELGRHLLGVLGDVPHGEALDVETVRVDYIEVRRPVHGFVDRRLTTVECD